MEEIKEIETGITSLEFVKIDKRLQEILELLKNKPKQVIKNNDDGKLFVVNVNVPVVVKARNVDEALDLTLEQFLLDEISIILEAGGEFFDKSFQVDEIRLKEDIPEGFDLTYPVFNSDKMIEDFLED